MGRSQFFYGMLGNRASRRERRSITPEERRARLGSMRHASAVARAVRGGAEPDSELVKLQGKVSPEMFGATLRVLSEAPAGIPRALRDLVKEQPEPAAPSQP
jgi:hypothetical protein